MKEFPHCPYEKADPPLALKNEPIFMGGEGQNLGVLIVLERTNLCSLVQSNGKKVQPLYI